jgi:hypothetical protein
MTLKHRVSGFKHKVFVFERVGKASSALKNVRVWIVAMLTYFKTLKIVNPMREKAAEMNAKLKIVMADLNVKLA